MRNPAEYCFAFLLALAACLFSASCSDGSVMKCASNADCPEGYFCNISLKHCDLQNPDGGEDAGDDDGGDVSYDGENGADVEEVDGSDDVADDGCPEPQEFEKYCINPNGYECDYMSSFCQDGQWQCRSVGVHPPPPPDFEDWAWRCGVYTCYAWNIPDSPGDDWQDEQTYVPPDPGSLTGEWTMVANDDDIVPLGCEKQPRQFAQGDCLEVDPTNPNVMYAGFFVADLYPSYTVSGVFKSVDGGQTWFEARAGLGSRGCYGEECAYGTAVLNLYMDPVDSSVLFASTTERGLYRTLNSGRTWEFVDLPDECAWAGPVGSDPSGTYYAACEGTLYRSFDGGLTFELDQVLGHMNRWITSFGFDERYPERVWSGMSEGLSQVPGEGYLFLSDNGGDSWIEMGKDIDDFCQGVGAVRDISICEADPDQMAASVFHCGLFLSNDGGTSWHRTLAPIDGHMTLTARFAPSPDRCLLYASEGNACKLWKTEDSGKTWQEELQTPLDDLSFNPFVPEMIFGLQIQNRFENEFELWIRE